MNRRDLFSFLAAAPVGAAAVITGIAKPEHDPEFTIKLPVNAPAGQMITVINNGKSWLTIT